VRMEYDPMLIEQTVRLVVRRDSPTERALHRSIDPIYRIEDAEARDHAFTDAFMGWFARLGLEAPLAALVDERPLIGERCSRCIVREAAKRSAQCGELFIRREDEATEMRTLLLQLLPESLGSLEQVTPLLRRELLHVSDMLNERFGYRAEDLSSLTREEHLVRDCYRILWDIYVESRLVRERRIDGRGVDRLAGLFERAFTQQGERPPRNAFEAAWAIQEATHGGLLELARHPERLVGEIVDCRLAVVD
jgi:hypothetical protein